MTKEQIDTQNILKIINVKSLLVWDLIPKTVLPKYSF